MLKHALLSARQRSRHGLLGTLLATLALSLPVPSQAQDNSPPEDPATTPEQIEDSGLDAELFYQLLLGELQVLDSEPGSAYSMVLDAARRTQREELYRRAVEIALQARSGNAALSAARDWATAVPSNDEPHRFVLQILLALNRPAEIVEPLRKLIELAPADQRAEVIGAIPQILARTGDKAAALTAARSAFQPFMADPTTAHAVWSSLGRMQLAQQDNKGAIESARLAMDASPTAGVPALLALELMERGEPGAEQLVRRFLDTNGRDKQRAFHLGYLRVLIDQHRQDQAGAELDELLKTEPKLADAWWLQGTLQLQQRQYAAARSSLEQYLVLSTELPQEAVRQNRMQAFLMLAQIAEQQKDYATANAWLDRIDDPQNLIAAQLRRATLLARQGQIAKARELLQQQPERTPEDSRRKLLAEAQLLRDVGEYPASLQVYAEAVRRFPGDPDLLYEQAMTADKAGKTADMENLLRELIAQHPDYHHAYNALGYALADRNERLPEAKTLIQQALRAAPNDPFILDSLGWVEFRQGNTREAWRILQDAYQRRPDAEISAHLGEVLWVLGQRDAALRVWREGLLLNPENATLLETLRRLNAKP